MDQLSYRDFCGNPVSTGVSQNPPPPPGFRRNFREFSRFDYSHDVNPVMVPHVREYEHGLWSQGIPVFNPRIPPPPIVRNSVSQNPSLAAMYSPRDPSLNMTSFQSLRRDMFDNDIPPYAPQGSLPPGLPVSDILTRFQSLESKIASLEKENKLLKVQGVKGGEVPVVDNVEYGAQDDELFDPTGDGNYAHINF